jgi:hypothetical protein
VEKEISVIIDAQPACQEIISSVDISVSRALLRECLKGFFKVAKAVSQLRNTPFWPGKAGIRVSSQTFIGLFKHPLSSSPEHFFTLIRAEMVRSNYQNNPY